MDPSCFEILLLDFFILFSAFLSFASTTLFFSPTDEIPLLARLIVFSGFLGNPSKRLNSVSISSFRSTRLVNVAYLSAECRTLFLSGILNTASSKLPVVGESALLPGSGLRNSPRLNVRNTELPSLSISISPSSAKRTLTI